MPASVHRGARTPARAMTFIAVLVAALFALVVPAGADPVGTQAQLSASVPLEESWIGSDMPQIAYGKGRSLVVWQQTLPTERHRVFARFADGAGRPAGDAFAVTGREADRPISEEAPDVAYDAAHEQFLVVWADYDNEEERAAVRAQRIALDGTRIGPVILVEEVYPRDIAVAWSAAADRFAVLWTDTDGWSVRARLVDTGGTPLGTSVVVAPDGRAGDIAYDAKADRWLAVFEVSSEERGMTVDGQLLAPDLARLGDPFPIGEGDDEYRAAGQPAVAATADGYRVAYSGAPQYLRRRGVAQPRARIWVRAVTGAGAVSGAPVLVTKDPPFFEYLMQAPAIAYDSGADQVLVAWAAGGLAMGRALPFAEHEVFGQRLDRTIAQLGTDDVQISDHAAMKPPGESEYEYFGGNLPAVAYDASTCTYVVAWQGDSTPQGKQEVYVRAFDAPDCAPRPPAVTTAAQSIVLPKQCTSRRRFTIHLRQRRGVRYVSAVVTVNGRRVKVVTGRRISAVIELTGMPKGRVTVAITVKTAAGRTLKAKRHYLTCSARQAPSNGLERKGAL